MHMDDKASMPRIYNPACFSMCGLFQKCLDFGNLKGRDLGKVVIRRWHTSTWHYLATVPENMHLFWEPFLLKGSNVVTACVWSKRLHMRNLCVSNASKFRYWQLLLHKHRKERIPFHALAPLQVEHWRGTPTPVNPTWMYGMELETKQVPIGSVNSNPACCRFPFKRSSKSGGSRTTSL